VLRKGRSVGSHANYGPAGRRSGSAVGLLSTVALTATVLSGLAAPRAERDPCRASAPRTDSLASLGKRGELILASGARVVLSGLRWPDDATVADQANAWVTMHRGAPLTLTARGGEDRWGRSRADVLIEGDAPVDLAGSLIAAGLAHADAGEVDTLCRPGLLALEGTPRANGIGVWQQPVHEAREGDGLAASVGRFVVAQGHVRSVGERPNRTYLDFGHRDEPGLSVTVQKRTWRTMLEHGLSAAMLRGRLVRVRGTLEIWRGPLLDIASADMIEVLEGEPALRR